MKNAASVSDHVNQIINWAQNRPEILSVYLFGSQAAGRANALSDIDIGILVTPNLSKARMWELELEWAGRSPSSVDLHIVNLGPTAFQYEVTAHGNRIWCADPGRAAELISLIWRKYWDLKPLLDRHWQQYIAQQLEAQHDTQRQQHSTTFDHVRSIHRRVKEAATDRNRAI